MHQPSRKPACNNGAGGQEAMIQKITGKTRIVGVIGAPVEHSRSPQMHNAALAKANLDYVYVPFHVPAGAVAAAMDGFDALNVVGINVTLPHKHAVIPFLTSISREAELIGAVNTLTFQDNGEIHGDNTDAPGFLRALEEKGAQVPTGEAAVVLGAGGSARAVVVALALAGVRFIVIANRTVAKAAALSTELSEKIRRTDNVSLTGMGLQDSRLPEAVNNSALIVNTASASMDVSHPLLINPEWLQSSTTVYDIVYTPPMTSLLTAAEAKGCPIVGGIGMLIHQGAIAFEKWTGVKPCVDTMRSALS